jgi:hypothetical protein
MLASKIIRWVIDINCVAEILPKTRNGSLILLERSINCHIDVSLKASKFLIPFFEVKLLSISDTYYIGFC